MQSKEAIEDYVCNYLTDTAQAKRVLNALQDMEQEPMREFTEEEAKAYSKALDRMYKPTGFNVFKEPCDDVKEIISMLNILLDNAKVGCADITIIHHVSFDSFKFVIEQTIKALEQNSEV